MFSLLQDDSGKVLLGSQASAPVRDSVPLDFDEREPLREKLMVSDTVGDAVRLSDPLELSELEGVHVGDAVLVALHSMLIAPLNGNRSARSSSSATSSAKPSSCLIHFGFPSARACTSVTLPWTHCHSLSVNLPGCSYPCRTPSSSRQLRESRGFSRWKVWDLLAVQLKLLDGVEKSDPEQLPMNVLVYNRE